MRPYNIQFRPTCPKCGRRTEHPVPVIYRYGDHGFVCHLAHEHLHGSCDFCGYDGVEYIFTVKEKKP